MLQYLTILLDDTSVSFCHYKIGQRERSLIPLETLKKAVIWGMKENLMIQFVYPDYELSKEYVEVIESIDHFNIKPTKHDADIWVTKLTSNISSDVPVVITLNKQELFENTEIIADIIKHVPRLNLVITDLDSFERKDFNKYKESLILLSDKLEQIIIDGGTPILNLLTDRMMLKQMNNCNAGLTGITLASNGRFYICPAFYYEEEAIDIGNIEDGLKIWNDQLFRIDHAPICSHCDAFQCKRCVWLNQKMTYELNTPSHEQCVVAHIERNISKELSKKVHDKSIKITVDEIKEIDYLDPFEKKEEWI